MKKQRKRLKKEVREELKRRSNQKCECCGLDIIIDKHHIWEFAKGGPDTADNILCLCQSCHSILPRLLDEDDQKYIQTLNFEKRSDTFSFSASDAEFEIGGIIYKNCERLLEINGKTVIYVYKLNSRLYANIIMLKGFDPYLLIIGNRVTYKSSSASLISTPNLLEVRHNDKRILKIEGISGKIKVYLNFTFEGHIFDINEKESLFPGYSHLRGIVIENVHESGLSVDFPLKVPTA